MMTSQAGRDLIKRWEGLRVEAYRCPAGVLTIGYGHTGDVKQGDKITDHQAEAILGLDLDRFERHVEELCPNATQPQFDALVSFAFNLGEAALERSTLRKKFLKGDFEGAQLEFAKWVNAGGRKLPGLVARRLAEAELFGPLDRQALLETGLFGP